MSYEKKMTVLCKQKLKKDLRIGRVDTVLGMSRPNRSPWRLLRVLGVLAVKGSYGIHRQDAKSAKNFAKQNSFNESKDFQLSRGLFRYHRQDSFSQFPFYNGCHGGIQRCGASFPFLFHLC